MDPTTGISYRPGRVPHTPQTKLPTSINPVELSRDVTFAHLAARGFLSGFVLQAKNQVSTCIGRVWVSEIVGSDHCPIVAPV